MHPIDFGFTSVRDSRLDESEWKYPKWAFPQYTSYFGTLDHDTSYDGKRAEVILTGIETLAQREDPGNGRCDSHRITRIELLWSEETAPNLRARRGAIFFSQGRGALLHCTNALLGYGGSGPGLTEWLFNVLGAGNLFEEINTAVLHHRYHVIVSRERTTVIHGVETPLSHLPPLDEWRWWRL